MSGGGLICWQKEICFEPTCNQSNRCPKLNSPYVFLCLRKIMRWLWLQFDFDSTAVRRRGRRMVVERSNCSQTGVERRSSRSRIEVVS